MSERREEETHAAAESSADAVPRGQWWASYWPTSDSNEPPAQRRRLEEAPARPQWTLESMVEDILMEGNFAFNLTLNDFLRGKFSGRGIVESNEGVLMEEFAADPMRFIHDAELLGTIKASEPYNWVRRVMERKKNNERIIMRDVADLHRKGVLTLKQWGELGAEGMDGTERTRKLDKALHDLRLRTILLQTPTPEGLYESVYNATWSHVVEASDGEWMGMVVKEGKPPFSWKYKEAGGVLENYNEKDQFHPPRPRLMILTSDRGWPYSWRMMEAINNCYITSEVERVWRIVQGDLNGAFVTDDINLIDVRLRLLLGTPGIGKSMNAGSYLLHQLLHYDDKKLQVVVYCFGGELAYVFDKTKKTVAECFGEDNIITVVNELPRRCMNGYVIYDVDETGHGPSDDLPPSTSWGMIVLSCPHENQFEAWRRVMRPRLIIMNCPDESDVKAMCAWETRDRPAQEQADYWKVVEKRIYCVGPILLCVLTEAEYVERFNSTEDAVNSMTSSDVEHCSIMGTGKLWHGESVSHQLIRLVRIKGDIGCEEFLNAPVCEKLWHQAFEKLSTIMEEEELLLLAWRLMDSPLSGALEKCTAPVFILSTFVDAIQYKLEELQPPAWRPRRPCALRVWPSDHPKKSVLLPPLEYKLRKVDVEHGVLYVPAVKSFPLMDAFFFLKSSQKTMVGLQVATSKRRHITTSTVRQFNAYMAEYFNVEDTFALDFLWEIIYVQRAGSVPTPTWQRCGIVQQLNGGQGKAEEKIAAFWNRNVHQYQLEI
ncbi:retrotransposon hot spot (RHS) protein [Trypanosoma conorhini]|uniref:Retrotransposon hot spot (RHS) protein n=1 Tax=Trypanosoma conorhini TaxID=83891 RepID=A0A3R7K379_9TRYP|nr:retrotransposon hot spot (RHS) protein [Trypanosoma conorhini]RNE99678.1 retrotransposon hot spot (RHS) protein [Trypanosoma conorhini]